jgi:WD40 repeat protein
MSRIFLSHSSKDNASAVALRDWLAAQGWHDIFLDLDPQRGIVAGAKWERELNQAALRCEAVLFLVSRAWLASDWCLKEFNLAHRLNKRLFGLLIEDIPVTELPAMLTGTWQAVPLASGRDHITLQSVLPGTHDEVHVTFSKEGLTRLRFGLERAGLDARFFAWPPVNDPKRSPYRGLLPLEAGDTGIFFGREAPTIEVLDRIRGIRDGAAPRFLVLLGASGAGKSSFLRAGFLPRLARDDRNYIVLPVIRPERAAINGEAGLLRALETAFVSSGLVIARADIRAAVQGGATMLRPLVQTVVNNALTALALDDPDAKPPALVLSIDQGEELFLTEGAAESTAFLGLLRELLTEDAPALLVVVTIRSDAYEQLQTAKPLEGVPQQTLSLSPMPRGAYQSVIEGPAARLKNTDRPLLIDPLLTQALLSDIEDGGGRDALPLLAFTLQRLYLEYGARGRLTLQDYDALGRIKGSIEAAVEQAFAAADADTRIPRDHEARLALLRRGLIPWLAGIDPDTGSPRRVKALVSEIPAEARPLIDLLVEQRLLSTDVEGDSGAQTIEPAHESLLRQWGSLQGWLQEDFAALTSLETVKRAARDWTANAKTEDWLAHRAGRLEDAERLLQRPDLAGKLEAGDRAYLAACREREEAERREKTAALERRLRLTRRFSVAAALAAAVMAGVGLYAYAQKTKAESATEFANSARAKAEASQASAVKSRSAALLTESKFLSDAASQAIARSEPVTGLLLALEALPDAASDDEIKRMRPYWPPAEVALESGRRLARETIVISRHRATVTSVAITPDGSRIVSGSYGEVYIWNGATGAEIFQLQGSLDGVNGVAITADGSRVVTAGSATILWDAYTGTQVATLAGHASDVLGVAITPDGSRIATGSADETVGIWDGKTGRQLASLRGHTGVVRAVALTADGQRVFSASADGTARIWDVASGQQVLVINNPAREPAKSSFISIGITPDGSHVITGSTDHIAQIWDARSGAEQVVLHGHDGWVSGVILTADASRAVTSATDGTVRIWDAKSGIDLQVLNGHASPINGLAMTPDGSRIVTSAGEEIATGKKSDNTVRIWNGVTSPEAFRLDGHAKQVNNIAVAHDGLRIITGSGDNTARVLNAESGALLHILAGHTSPVTRVAITPDGSRFVTASVDKTARIWDGNSGAELFVLKGHTDVVSGLAITPDGSALITGSADKTVRIWDINSGKELAKYSHNGRIWCLAVTPDGKRLVTGSDDTARILDLRTGAELSAFKGLHGVVQAVVVAPDGSRIVTGSVGGVLGVWNVDTGAEISRLIVKDANGVEKNIDSVAFTPDGKRIITATLDQYFPSETASVWDARTFVEIARFGRGGHLPNITALAVMPDGRRAVVGAQDGKVAVWHLFDTGQELIDEVKDVVPRCLSPEERKRYFLDVQPPNWCMANKKWPYDR